MKFNLGKFNVATDVVSIRGQSVLELDASIQIEVERRNSGQAVLVLEASAQYGVEYHGSGAVSMGLEAALPLYEVERGGVGCADLALSTDLDWTLERPGSGTTSMAMDVVLQRYEVERRADGGARMVLSTNRPDQTVEKFASVHIGMSMGSFMDPTRLKYAPGAEEMAMEIWTSGITNLLGVDSIHLVVNLQPGDTLELDMCEMTALLNNENAMKYLASDGDFFDFPAGKNDIIVDVTPANVPIESEIYYKDRWL